MANTTRLAARLLVPCWMTAFGTTAARAQMTQESGGAYFGAPVIELTRLRGQAAVMFGGRGGWYLTPSLAVGAGLYGTLTEVDAPAQGGSPGPLDVKYEEFGLELEYHFRSAAPVHFTLAAFAGGATARYVRDGTDEQHGETDFMLLVEPAAGIEWSASRRVHVNLAAAFRLTGPVEQAGLRGRHLRGPAVRLAVKLGKF